MKKILAMEMDYLRRRAKLSRRKRIQNDVIKKKNGW
jgi:hypothetical protein